MVICGLYSNSSDASSSSAGISSSRRFSSITLPSRNSRCMAATSERSAWLSGAIDAGRGNQPWRYRRTCHSRLRLSMDTRPIFSTR
ncbi:hypothetical protein D3C78_1435680 [compost metagenome]